MSGLLLLPLDDRPVNLDTPQLLAALIGESLCTPPRALLGRFLQPGQPDALAEWLPRQTADIGIISLDMLAYGGLVASRTPAVSVPEALRRLDALREMKRRNPGVRLYAFNVIMRLTITGADAETRAAGREIFRYSVLRDQAERLGDAGAAAELPAVIARIPPALLEAYLAARARNHAVNRAALELLADGVLDFLALVQEDTAPAGLHLTEQAALTALAGGRVAPERWRLYAGTDEAGQTLLARAVLQRDGITTPVVIRLRDEQAADFPALYEDVPLRETVRRHVDAVGATAGTNGITLAAHTFTPPQPDLFDLPSLPAPTWEAALEAYPAADVARWLTALDGPLAVADLAYCNGGDPHLLSALFTHRQLDSVYSYAGWNTAGNTLGTALAHSVLRAAALERGATAAMDAAQQAALFIRILDDGLYQSIVRPWVMSSLQEFGASALNLGSATSAIEARVDAAMQALWREFVARHPRAAALSRPFRAVLPWGRLFETRIELREGA